MGYQPPIIQHKHLVGQRRDPLDAAIRGLRVMNICLDSRRRESGLRCHIFPIPNRDHNPSVVYNRVRILNPGECCIARNIGYHDRNHDRRISLAFQNLLPYPCTFVFECWQ